MLWIWPTTWIELPGESCFCRSATILLISPTRCRDRGPERLRRPRRPAECSSDSRWSARCRAVNVATLLSSPGTGASAEDDDLVEETGVLPRSLSELTLVLRRLDGEVIGNSRRRIGPEIRRHLLGRAQAHVDVGGDGVRIEPELSRPRAVDGGVERRSIDLLLQMRIGDARNGRDAPPQLLRHPQVRRPVVADGADVDLRRQAEIEDLGHDVGRLEIEHDLRECGRQRRAQLAHIVARSGHGPPSARPG